LAAEEELGFLLPPCLGGGWLGPPDDVELGDATLTDDDEEEDEEDEDGAMIASMQIVRTTTNTTDSCF
jgi:hypothetical protein